MNKELTRLELYDLVWSKPMTTLSKEYNMSDNGLRKICKKHDIPLPNAGYWAKIKYGYKPPKPKLPKLKVGNEKIDIYVSEIAKGNPDKKVDFLPQILSNKKLVFQVQHYLTNPDQLIIDTKEELEIEQKPWDDPLRRNRRHKDRLVINVSKKAQPRALRIFNNLIQNLKLLNYNIECNSSGTSIISIDKVKVSISLREKNNAIYTENNHGWKTRELTPNGLLTIKLEGLWSTREISDSELVKIEDQIPKILAKIESLFFEKRTWTAKCEVERIERERKQEIARLIQKAKDDELRKFKDFYNSAHRWKEFMILKEYFEMIKSTSQDNETPEISEWLVWAKIKLDWYNPTIALPDELLNDVDKDTLEYKNKTNEPLRRFDYRSILK